MLNYGKPYAGDDCVLLSHLTQRAILPAFELLPERMGTKAATVFLLAIALQESGAKARRQAADGPARGYWQFEHGGGVAGVLAHPSSAYYASAVCAALDYEANSVVVYRAIEHNDILAAAFARLLLWTLPQPLAVYQGAALEQYLDTWRPGAPHPERWEANWNLATDHVRGSANDDS